MTTSSSEKALQSYLSILWWCFMVRKDASFKVNGNVINFLMLSLAAIVETQDTWISGSTYLHGYLTKVDKQHHDMLGDNRILFQILHMGTQTRLSKQQQNANLPAATTVHASLSFPCSELVGRDVHRFEFTIWLCYLVYQQLLWGEVRQMFMWPMQALHRTDPA